MTEEEAFVQAIIDDPDNDGPRLIYADWLEEHGRSERAEFIRVQCEMAQMDTTEDWDNPRYGALKDRQRGLFSCHAEEWGEPFGPEGLPGPLRRGFVEHVHVYGPDFIKWADTWFRCSPIRSAWLRGVNYYHRRLLAVPQLSRLTSLTLREIGSRTCGASQSFAASPYVANLTQLGLHLNTLHDVTLRTLLSSPYLKKVTSLDLNTTNLGLTGVRILLSSPLAEQLTELILSENPIGLEGARELLTSSRLPRLLSLDLSGSLEADIAAALTDVTPLLRLTHLDLSANGLGAQGFHWLTATSLLKGVRILNLSANRLRHTQIRALTSTSHLDRLETLNLSRNSLNDAAVRALAEWPGLRQLKVLDISATSISTRGVQVLAESPHLRPRLRLFLSGGKRPPKKRKDLRSRFGDRISVWFIDD